MIRASIYQDFLDDQVSIYIQKTDSEESESSIKRTHFYLKVFGESKWVEKNPGVKSEPFLRMSKMEMLSLLRALVEAMEENGFVRTKLEQVNETKKEMSAHIQTLREVSSRLMGLLENETARIHNQENIRTTRFEER